MKKILGVKSIGQQAFSNGNVIAVTRFIAPGVKLCLASSPPIRFGVREKVQSALLVREVQHDIMFRRS
jgi:hypothetical protein